MRARRPNKDETCGDRAGAGEMEPGRLGRGRNGDGGWGAAHCQRGGLQETLSSQVVSRLLLRLKSDFATEKYRQVSMTGQQSPLALTAFSSFLFLISPSPRISVLC